MSRYFNWKGGTKKAGISPNPPQHLSYHPNVPKPGHQGLLSCGHVQGWQKVSPWDGMAESVTLGWLILRVMQGYLFQLDVQGNVTPVHSQGFFLPFLNVCLSGSERE